MKVFRQRHFRSVQVCLGFKQFKDQMSHRCTLYVIRLNGGPRVGRQSANSWPTMRCPTRWWDRILIFYLFFTVFFVCCDRVCFCTLTIVNWVLCLFLQIIFFVIVIFYLVGWIKLTLTVKTFVWVHVVSLWVSLSSYLLITLLNAPQRFTIRSHFILSNG